LAATWLDGRKGCSQKHISLMNLHRPVQFKHKQYILGSLFDMLLIYDWPFLHVCILQGNLLFSYYQFHFVISNYGSNTSEVLTLCGIDVS